MLFLLAAIVTFHTDFEGGSLEKVEPVSDSHYRLHVRGDVDQDKRNRQASWYYFRIDGAAGRDLVLDMLGLPGEYNYKPNRGAIGAKTLPFLSYDGRTWTPFQAGQADYDAAEPRLRLRLRPARDRVFIAHQPPYTHADLNALLRDVRRNAAVTAENVGKTVQGRDMPLLTITDPKTPAKAKKVLWVMFRQHAWESGSSWAGEGAVRFLVSSDPAAAQLRRTAIFKIFPMCDPDGVARGSVRFNIHGYDLNRNWDAVDAAKMPEIAAQRKVILDWVDGGRRFDMLVTLHNTEEAEYIAGPKGPEHLPLLKRFEAALSASDTFQPTRPAASSPETTTSGKPGRMTVYQGLYHDRKLPAFLIEKRIVKHPELGRQPNIDDQKRFGEHLVRAMAGSVQ
jgi:hypothetical protein